MKYLKKLLRVCCLGLLGPTVFLYRKFNPDIWLFFSRPDESDGNAYALYQWAKDRKKCYFVLQKDCAEFEDGMIAYHSVKHLFLSAAAKVHVFDTIETADLYSRVLRKIFGLDTKYVFLQHGVTRVDIPLYHYENTAYDLCIATTRREYRFLHQTFHYPEERLALTGHARHDDLLLNASDKRFIFIAPTWNKDAKNMGKEDFFHSAFYLRFQSLLNNKQFAAFLRNNHIKLRFCLHYMIQDKADLFDLPADVEIYNDADSIHELLRDCSLLITDYSSVAFDTALAGKPVIYYQFQADRYKSADSYFQYETDGFGPVVSEEAELIGAVQDLWNGHRFERPSFYNDRCNAFFEFRDTDNCKRIYDRIETMLKEK